MSSVHVFLARNLTIHHQDGQLRKRPIVSDKDDVVLWLKRVHVTAMMLPSSARAYKTLGCKGSLEDNSRTNILTFKACEDGQSAHRGNNENRPCSVEAKPQHVRRGETGTQERQGRGAGTATGTRDSLVYGSVVGRQPTDPLLGFRLCESPSSLVPRPTSHVPTAAPQLPSLQACSLTSPGPGRWTSPNWACSNNLRAAPSPQSFLLPPRRRSLHLHLSPDTSPPSASHIQPRPPPHSCTFYPSCLPPPARGSKTPRRTRSSLPFLPTTREKKKRSKSTVDITAQLRRAALFRRQLPSLSSCDYPYGLRFSTHRVVEVLRRATARSWSYPMSRQAAASVCTCDHGWELKLHVAFHSFCPMRHFFVAVILACSARPFQQPFPARLTGRACQSADSASRLAVPQNKRRRLDKDAKAPATEEDGVEDEDGDPEAPGEGESEGEPEEPEGNGEPEAEAADEDAQDEDAADTAEKGGPAEAAKAHKGADVPKENDLEEVEAVEANDAAEVAADGAEES
ncbi:uncharacterized protein J3D65DRAFT_599299 [Phyllosticta citribraziliensis]|uniref:Uncharacterized protein n=1 Tax=Phyllosticta citribraziliensis TaxID=989973 RepID=A0ABR1MBR4_9PEZI